MKTNTSIGIIGAGEGDRHKSFATNLLYYQHHSIFTNTKKKSSKNQKKERKNLQFIYAEIHQNFLQLDLLKVLLMES